MLEWLKDSLKEMENKKRDGQKYSIKAGDEWLVLLSKTESFIKTGVLRVLYCLYAVPKGLRYSELEELTELPRPSLLKILKHLKTFNLITTKEMVVAVPRKDNVPFYVLTANGHNFIENFIFLNKSILENLFKKNI